MEEQIQAILEKYTDDLYYESPEGIDISDLKLVKKELNDLFSLHIVSQQSELLAFLDWVGKNTPSYSIQKPKQIVQAYLKANCG